MGGVSRKRIDDIGYSGIEDGGKEEREESMVFGGGRGLVGCRSVEVKGAGSMERYLCARL